LVVLLLPSSAGAQEQACEAFIWLQPACSAGKKAAEVAGAVAAAPIKYAANSAVEMVTGAVAEAATWLLRKVVGFIDSSTSPDLTADWFNERYRLMVGLGALVVVPMLMLASIRAIMQQDVSQLLRSFFVYLPAAIFGTFLMLHLAQALLTGTDALSAAVAKGVAGDVSAIFDSVSDVLSTPSSVGTPPAIPAFAMLIGAFLLVIGSFFVWLELLVRSAAVTVSVFFMPLILAAMVWPATAHWTKRLIQTLVALILSKFVIVSVMSLATAALADPGGGGFGTIMGGAALMLMAAFAPIGLMKLMPLAEGAAVAHLEGMGRRPLATVQAGGSVNHAASIMRSKVSGVAGSSRLAMAGPKNAMTGGAAGAGAAVAAGAVTGGAVKAAKAPGRRMERQGDAAASKTTDSAGGTLRDSSPRPPRADDGRPGRPA
jgi:hypothetical protein